MCRQKGIQIRWLRSDHKRSVVFFYLAALCAVLLVEIMTRHSIDPYSGPPSWQILLTVHHALDAVVFVLFFIIPIERVAVKCHCVHRALVRTFCLIFIALLVTGLPLFIELEMEHSLLHLAI